MVTGVLDNAGAPRGGIGWQPRTDHVVTPAPAPSRWTRVWRKSRTVVARLVKIMVLAAVLVEVAVLPLVWWAPPATMFMAIEPGAAIYQYVSLDHVSRFAVAAALAHEDDDLGPRSAPFDVAAFVDRAQAHSAELQDPSGSTIPQQLAKNLFLYRESSVLRKALEVPFATALAATVSDRRIVELYLNYAQFGAGLYGICAASWYYYGSPPWLLSLEEAARLVGALPGPDLAHRVPGGGIDVDPAVSPRMHRSVNEAEVWVPGNVDAAGGWRVLVASIGVVDEAEDHAERRSDPEACSTMPAAVAERLAREAGGH